MSVKSACGVSMVEENCTECERLWKDYARATTDVRLNNLLPDQLEALSEGQWSLLKPVHTCVVFSASTKYVCSAVTDNQLDIVGLLMEAHYRKFSYGDKLENSSGGSDGDADA